MVTVKKVLGCEIKDDFCDSNGYYAREIDLQKC